MEIDVNNFDEFTAEEHRNNLLRLGIPNYSSLVGDKILYSKPSYGKHKVLKWDPDKAEYLLDLGGDKFWTNPFRLLAIKDSE